MSCSPVSSGARPGGSSSSPTGARCSRGDSRGARGVRLRESWRNFKPEQVRDFLRAGHEGRDHPSRLKVIELLQGMTSVLDVGCGTGVMFELIRERRPDLDYLGIDVTAQFVAAAREQSPAGARLSREGLVYELQRVAGASGASLSLH